MAQDNLLASMILAEIKVLRNVAHGCMGVSLASISYVLVADYKLIAMNSGGWFCIKEWIPFTFYG